MNKFQPDGVDLIEWYDDLLKTQGVRYFNLEQIEQLLYKGFKIVKNKTRFPTMKDYHIYDTTKSDIDSPVSTKHLTMMLKHGIVKAIDLISMSRSQALLKISEDQLAIAIDEFETGTTKKYIQEKIESIQLDITNLEVMINRTINKYKL